LSPLPDIWPIPGKCAAHFAKLKISEALSAQLTWYMDFLIRFVTSILFIYLVKFT